MNRKGFRTDEDRAFPFGPFAGDRAQVSKGGFHAEKAVFDSFEADAEEVDASEEGGGEAVDGAAVEIERRADLLDDPLVEKRDAVAHAEGFAAVVGHIDGGQGAFPADAADFQAHFIAEFRVEVGKRFVEKQNPRRNRHRAGQRHTLLLSAGKRRHAPLGEIGHPYKGKGVRHFFPDVFFRLTRGAESEGDIFKYGEVRPESVVLEDHRRLPFFGWKTGDVRVVEKDFSVVGFQQSGDDPQQGGFSAAGRPQQEKEFARGDLQMDRKQNRISLLIGFRDAGNRYGSSHVPEPFY